MIKNNLWPKDEHPAIKLKKAYAEAEAQLESKFNLWSKHKNRQSGVIATLIQVNLVEDMVYLENPCGYIAKISSLEFEQDWT